MEHRLFKCIFLLWIGLFLVSLESSADKISKDNPVIYPKSDVSSKDNPVIYPASEVSLRFGAQWEISQVDKHALEQRYGVTRVSFDLQGRPIPKGISPKVVQRWYRLYNLCMSDGCYYCDAPEGSCESGTCGPSNSLCKPHMDGQGCPKCGHVCSDYAFTATLH